MKIIVGVDDSPFSAAAVEFVRNMNWPAGSRLEVLRAVPEVIVAIPETYLVMADQLERLRQEQRAAAEKHVQTVRGELASSGLPVETRVVDGDPRDVLVEAARATKADLVILGSHGRTGLRKLILGSVASHVVTHAPCSVLIVRRPAAALGTTG
jgi:nucleotide-binding universal stress UspA family protein